MLSLIQNLFKLIQLGTSTFVRCHRICTGTESYTRVHAVTHTRATPCTRQREREAREGLSVHAETACGVDPAISESENYRIFRGNSTQLRRFASPNTKNRRTIGGRPRPATTTQSIQPGIRLKSSQNAGLHHRFFLRLRRTAPF